MSLDISDLTEEELKKMDEFEKLSKDLSSFIIWSKDFEKSLLDLEQDIELKLKHGNCIFIAVDFYDIVTLLLPEQTIFYQTIEN